MTGLTRQWRLIDTTTEEEQPVGAFAEEKHLFNERAPIPRRLPVTNCQLEKRKERKEIDRRIPWKQLKTISQRSLPSHSEATKEPLSDQFTPSALFSCLEN